MLTNQHRFSATITDPDERQVWRISMCGLCHALGDEYGLPYRLLTSYETILLNTLTNAQLRDEPDVVVRRCPLNPLIKVSTNRNVSSRFSAAIAVGLTTVGVEDDMQDSDGQSIGANLAKWFLRKPFQKALQHLRKMGFETTILTHLGQMQTLVEQQGALHYAAKPSAEASARLFAMTADLTNNHHNKRVLAIIGANFGTYTYLVDALNDYVKDMAKDDYNPLEAFSQQDGLSFTLSNEGVSWLLEQFLKIQSSIHQHIHQLQLYRYKNLLVHLICTPIDETVEQLSMVVKERKEFVFKKWSIVDILKTGFFMPSTVSTMSDLQESISLYGSNQPGGRGQKRELRPGETVRSPIL